MHLPRMKTVAVAVGAILIAGGWCFWRDCEQLKDYARSAALIDRLGGSYWPPKVSLEDAGVFDFQPVTLTLGVDLSGTRVSDDDLRGLAGLAYCENVDLDLSYTSVSDRGIEYLDGLPIDRLNLGGTHVSANRLRWLMKRNPRINIVFDDATRHGRAEVVDERYCIGTVELSP